MRDMMRSAARPRRRSCSGDRTSMTSDRTSATFSGRVDVTPQLGVEPTLSFNWIDLPEGRFTNTVAGGRATFTMTPRMFVAALIQYSSSTSSISTNIRFRWEYLPSSELFVVYTEGRSTVPPQGTALQGRGVGGQPQPEAAQFAAHRDTTEVGRRHLPPAVAVEEVGVVVAAHARADRLLGQAAEALVQFEDFRAARHGGLALG